jgi:Skp family chaperone for outer membrane proteins
MRLFAIGAFALASLTASAAVAQTAGPANPGPVIPGVCVYSNPRLLVQSTVGQAVQARMQQLSEEADAEAYQANINSGGDITRIQTLSASIGSEAERQAYLQREFRTLELEIRQRNEIRDNELRYTLNEQRRLISAAVEPILVAVHQERGCGLHLSQESVFMMNPAMDVTDAVIQRLNVALPSLSFNRMSLPVQQTGQ